MPTRRRTTSSLRSPPRRPRSSTYQFQGSIRPPRTGRSPSGALPTITNSVTIDGYSQAEVGIPFRYPTEAGLSIQTLSVLGNPTGGTFSLTGLPSAPFTPTPPIPWDATAAQVQAAIESVIGAGTVTVTGGPAPNEQMTIVFGGPFARQIVGPLGSANNLLTGGINPGVNAQSVSLGGILSDPTLITSTPNGVQARDGNDARVRVIIDGSHTGGGTGFVLDTSHSVLRGLAIDGFGIGVSVPAPQNTGNLIQGNFIGQYLTYPVNPLNGERATCPR